MNHPSSDRRTFLKHAMRFCVLAGLGAIAAGLVLRRTGKCAGDCASCGRLQTCDLPQAGKLKGGGAR